MHSQSNYLIYRRQKINESIQKLQLDEDFTKIVDTAQKHLDLPIALSPLLPKIGTAAGIVGGLASAGTDLAQAAYHHVKGNVEQRGEQLKQAAKRASTAVGSVLPNKAAAVAVKAAVPYAAEQGKAIIGGVKKGAERIRRGVAGALGIKLKSNPNPDQELSRIMAD